MMKKKLLFLLGILCLASCNASGGNTEPADNPDNPDDNRKTVEIYAFNDFHGQVEDKAAYTFSFFKQVSKNENTLIIDSGDTFQGSIYSNYNHGALITDLSNIAGVDVHTLGNHDFDWGQEYIISNIARKYNDYSTTWLASNVYKYENRQTNDRREDLGSEYYIKTLENGLKVGVVGVIGTDQWSSITSIYVDNIYFKDHIQVIKNVSDKLKKDKGCDFVIASIHAPYSLCKKMGLADISPVSGAKYCDLVFNGHSHVSETYTENYTKFIQTAGYGNEISHTTLTITDDNVVTNTQAIRYNALTSLVRNIDPEINQTLSFYNSQCDEEANKLVHPDMRGTFYANEQMANLVCEAIYDEYVTNQQVNKDYTVEYVMTNKARATYYGGRLTYGDLYEIIPFDNEVYVIECDVEDLADEIDYGNNFYRVTTKPLNEFDTITVAVIDYVALHMNVNHQYNYFPSLRVLDKWDNASTHESLNYREITRNYLEKNSDKTIYADEYSKTASWHFNARDVNKSK